MKALIGIGNEDVGIKSVLLFEEFQSLLENEFNGFNKDEYDAKYTAMEYESAIDQTKKNLGNVLGCSTCQSTNIILKRLDGIPIAIKFPAALERVNINLKARAMIADIKLSQEVMNNSANCIGCSGAVQLTMLIHV